MAEEFDPYHKWLAIPPEDQPVDHYRLLALKLFESDPDVISNAADQRMAHLRSFQTGQNAALSQRILNEIAAARVCLLNPAKKAQYDAALRAASAKFDFARHAARRKEPSWQVPAAIALGAAVIVAAVLLVVLRRPDSKEVALPARGKSPGAGGLDGARTGPGRKLDVAPKRKPGSDRRWRLLLYNRRGKLRVLKNGEQIAQIGEAMAMFASAVPLAEGDVIALAAESGDSGRVRVAGLSADGREFFAPTTAEIKDVTGVPPESLKAGQIAGVVKTADSAGDGKSVDRIAWNKAARDAPLYDSDFVTGGDGKSFTLAFAFKQATVRSVDDRHPPPPLDCGHGEWTGKMLLFSRQGTVQVLVGGRPVLEVTEPGCRFSPEITLRAGDVVVFRVEADEGVLRAGFVTRDGGLCMPLTAADLRDATGRPVGGLAPGNVAARKRTAIAVGKVPLTEVRQWEDAGGPLAPRGAEFVTAHYPACFQLAFPVEERLVRKARPRPPIDSRKPVETMTFKFSNGEEMARHWRWKAGFAMGPEGARGPQEPDNELVSRFALDGDFAVDLDADFGQAAYTNTGGMLIAVCGHDIGFDGGWNFGSWDGFNARVRVTRMGDEVLLIRDGHALVVPVPEAERDKPTHWRLWWRSRSSHFREIKVVADRVATDPRQE